MKKLCRKCKRFVAGPTGFCPYCFEKLRPHEKLIATGMMDKQNTLMGF